MTKFLSNIEELSTFIQSLDEQPMCLADTGFLYALAYDDDRLFHKATEAFELLSEHKVELYANVISRMEFIDLIFRKQVTQGCIELFDSMKHGTQQKPIFNLLKDIRDKDTAAHRQNQSYKIDERRLKKLREAIEQHDVGEWYNFCKKFVGSMLINEWILIEQEMGLNFIEVMEGGTSEEITSPLHWKDMVAVMGGFGLRGPDAMIVTLFSKSKFPILITTDSDFESCFLNENVLPLKEKVIFLLS